MRTKIQGISEERLRESRDEYLLNVYPVRGKAGNFICFLQWDDYVSFVALTRRLPGEYLEKKHPELITSPMDIREVQWVLQEDAERDGCPPVLTERMLYVSLLMRTHLDYVNKMKNAFPKDLFPDRWPK